MVSRVLLIEDSTEFQYLVSKILSPQIEVEVVSSAAEALLTMNSMKPEDFQLILLDLMLPDSSGFDFLREIKKRPEMRDKPLIVLTGNSEIDDRVLGFELGADDYIIKPFEPREFRARIHAKLNQSTPPASSAAVAEDFTRDRICLSMSQMAATLLDQKPALRIDLTPHEFRLLVFLVKNAGQTFSRDQLLEMVWSRDIHVLHRTIDRHISALRKKLKHRGAAVQSVRGVGYRFSLGEGCFRL